MTDFNINNLDDIQIPDSLEHRLSERIDSWEEAELMQKRGRVIKTAGLAAAAAAVVIAVGVHLGSSDGSHPAPGEVTDLQSARREVEHALTLLSANLHKGIDGVAQAEKMIVEPTLSE